MPAGSCLLTRITFWVFLTTATIWAQGGPPGGRIFDLFADPAEQDVVFAITANGVFRTDNGGLSWGPSSNGLTTVSTSAIVGAQGRLYIGTTLDGVFRSDDGGMNWRRVSDGLETLDIRSLAVDPNNADVLYAGTRNGGIFMTDNGGAGWIKVNNGLLLFTPPNAPPVFEGDYSAIAIAPNDSQTIYTLQSSAVNPGTGILFRTTNGGAQWNPIAFAGSGFSVKIDPEDSGTIYVGTSLGLTITHDSFASTEPDTFLGPTVTDIAIDPTDTDVLYVSTRLSRIFRSDDRGMTWTAINDGMAVGETFSLAVDPHTPARVYAGLNGTGVFRSLDMGTNWKLASDGIFGTDVRVIAIDPQDSSNVLAGAFGGGLFLSENGGNRWEEARDGLIATQPRAIAFAPQNPQVVYAGSVNPFSQGQGALFRSDNGGRDWENLPNGTGNSIYSIAVDSVNPQRFYVATASGVFRSDDGGQTFEGRNDVDQFSSGELLNWTITDLEMDPANPNVLYAVGTSFDPFIGQLYQFFKTDDAGDNWQPGAPTFTPLVDVTIDPTDTRRLYLATSSGIFRNEDASEENGFDQLVTGLPGDGNLSVTSIAVDGQDNGAVYAATSVGVYKSTNSGTSWTIADTGLETTLARVIRDDPSNAGQLYAGTSSSGVFKTLDKGATWVPTRNPITLLPVISRKGLVGSADFDGAGVGGGEIVSFFAVNVGPEVGVSAQFDPKTGKLPTILAGVRVFFNDIAAAMFFVRDGQINCQVPFEVIGLGTVEVRVEVDGVVSNTITVEILDAHPGIYPIVGNPDGSINSADNPAPGNSFVSLYTTGQGAVTPALMTGQPAPADGTLHVPVLAVRVLNGEQVLTSATALAPNFVGLLQINVILGNLPPGEYELFIEIGGRRSRLGVTIYVS